MFVMQHWPAMVTTYTLSLVSIEVHYPPKPTAFPCWVVAFEEVLNSKLHHSIARKQ